VSSPATVRSLASGRVGTAVLVAALAVASVALVPRLAPGEGELEATPAVSISVPDDTEGR
jgi:hypothetical protein